MMSSSRVSRYGENIEGAKTTARVREARGIPQVPTARPNSSKTYELRTFLKPPFGVQVESKNGRQNLAAPTPAARPCR